MATIEVEVAYALVDRQKIYVVMVDVGATIESVIRQSGVLVDFPEIDLQRQKVGIFSKVRELTDSVRAGDRVEIYRALVLDPKERRRRRG
jgi:putative ubiquitin-RnfH superfamily antitoxin RatB of RatAB toxin-antitoxin module